MAGTNGRNGPVLSLVGQERDVAFYAREAQQAGGPVLVLGAGMGRVAWALAARGLETVAVEPSEVMFRTADARRGAESPETAARMRLLQVDPRALRLDERFPIVLAPQNALALSATLDDVDAMLATVRHHLAEGGVFVFDVLNPRRDMPAPEVPEDRWQPLEGVEPPRPIFAPHLRERTRTAEGTTEGIRRLRLRHFTVEEIDQALREADFVATERFGSFDRRPFDPQDAVQVVVAVRAESGGGAEGGQGG